MNSVMINLKTKINERHVCLINGLKKSVQIAIEVGEYLTEVKEQCEHGKFVLWIEKNCEFSVKTAYNYLNLFNYKNKIVRVTNLQEAYTQIEFIEKKEKYETELKKKDKMTQRKKTGEKPEGWERADDYAWEKFIKEEKARDERIENAKKMAKENSDAKKNKQSDTDNLINDTKKLVDEALKYEDEKKRIIDSTSGNEDIIYRIDGVLDKLSDDNVKLEFCNTLIKYLRSKAVKYQQESIK